MAVARIWSLLFLLVPILGVATFVAGPYFNIWLPKDISEHGRTIDHLFYFILWLTGVVFVITEGVMFWFMWRYEAKTSVQPAKFTHGSHSLEVVWTILPAATLLFIAIYQMNAWADSKMRKPKMDATVEVDARQFEWRLRYPGRDDVIRHARRRLLGERSAPAGQRRDSDRAQQHGRAAQFFSAEHARQAGRRAGHDDSSLVSRHHGRYLRPGLRGTVRLGPLQDEGPADRSSRARNTIAGWKKSIASKKATQETQQVASSSEDKSMSTTTIGSHAHDDAHAAGHGHTAGFISKYVFSKDHKIIGIQFLFSTLLWFVVGGLLALGVRLQVAWPWAEMPVLGKCCSRAEGGQISPEFYTMLFTMHATVMIFFVIIPILAGAFGNFLIPLMIGADDMAFPTLNMLSYWFMWPAFIAIGASFFVAGGAAKSGWTVLSAALADRSKRTDVVADRADVRRRLVDDGLGQLS